MIFIDKVFLIILGILFGAIWYRYDLQPRPLFRRIFRGDYEKLTNNNLKISSWDDAKLTFSKYRVGVPLFLDRPYSDSFGDDRLNGLYVVQINRHEKKSIRIKTNSPITIYRFIPSSKSGLKQNYSKTKIKVEVIGKSINHLNVVKKTFEPGNIILYPGGPISSSPILFSLKFNSSISSLIIEKTN